MFGAWNCKSSWLFLARPALMTDTANNLAPSYKRATGIVMGFVATVREEEAEDGKTC
jgi:hypothetical protein